MSRNRWWSPVAGGAVVLAALLGAAACGEDDDAPAPRRETVGRYTVVYLAGSHYEMGRQHGLLLEQEIAAGVKSIDDDAALKAMFAMAQIFKAKEMAQKMSFQYILDECKGLVDAVGARTGWTMEHCLVLNFGDVVAEWVSNGKPEQEDITPGCSQVVTAPSASADGKMYHARILDWMEVSYIVKYPVIFVKRPTGGVPHVVVGFPGNLSPYQGMNAAGLSVASNEVHPRDAKVNDRNGRSHVQLVGKILAEARTLEEARAMARQINHMSMELIVVADGTAQQAEVLEMAPAAVDVRGIRDGAVYATNHFLGAATGKLDKDPPSDNTVLRKERLDQLAGQSHADSILGQVTPAALVGLMRDRKNPRTGQQSPAGTVDDGKSLASNGALYQLVFDPAGLRMWVAAGALPVPAQPFTGFNVGAMLGAKGHDGPAPATIP